MAELQFARQFLSNLDSHSIRLGLDYVEDARKYPSDAVYLLPRMPKPMSKPATSSSVPGQDRSASVKLKSLRNPPLDLTLPNQPLSITSILDLKNAVANHVKVASDKIRILYNKKPCSDSKTLQDVLGPQGGGKTVEFSVMVIGGAPAPNSDTPGPTAAPVAQGLSGTQVLASEAFWTDLKGFLVQRLRDEAEGERVTAVFRSALKD